MNPEYVHSKKIIDVLSIICRSPLADIALGYITKRTVS